MNLEQDIAAIKERNMRVEADKAWETSCLRIISIAVITYVVALVVLYFLGSEKFFLNALIPTIGYLLSTQSLSSIKRWWVRKYFHQN